MTALPQPPGRLLTVAEYAALGEDDQHRWELQKGIMVMSPGPGPDHMLALRSLIVQLNDQVPAELELVPEIDVDLELVPATEPGWCRRPDLVVVEAKTITRVRREGGVLRASEVRLVVEIVSPGSHRMDHVTKRGEYADACIPYYWIVDLDPPLSLLDCHFAGEFGHQDNGGVTGTFVTTAPFPLRLELDKLL